MYIYRYINLHPLCAVGGAGGWGLNLGVTFFKVVAISLKKNLKPEIFNDKKSSSAKIFSSVITKNSNCEIF